MQKSPLFIVALILFSFAAAGEEGELIFQDDFERTESQELKDEPGNGWGTNSRTRAKGNKQVDLRDGAMYIYIHEEADHGVSVTQPMEFTDGSVGLRFMLEHEKDALGLNFADLEYKAVHAGHLFAVKVGTKEVQIQDLKTGNMDLKMREARQAGTLTKEQKDFLETRQVRIPHRIETGKWYDLLVRVRGDVVTVMIDGSEVGSFQSGGIAHPTKRLLRLAVNRDAVVDEVRIWRNK